jgi:hypothetical protein
MSTEPILWEKAPSSSKSYLVQVLHWFHYRPHALKGSWRHEEVLTWELIRALEILPADCFVEGLVRLIGSKSEALAEVTTSLLSCLDDVTVTPYPSLQLDGSKRNCRADVGLGVPDGAQLWVEVKTGRAAARSLSAQLRAQVNALQRIAAPAPAAVVALLPDGMAATEVPSVSWSEVCAVLTKGLERLAVAVPAKPTRRGYERLAEELRSRIESHVGCIPPNSRLQRPAATRNRAVEKSK